MKLITVDRKKLYKREYKRDSIQELTGTTNDGELHDSLSRVVAQMIAQG